MCFIEVVIFNAHSLRQVVSKRSFATRFDGSDNNSGSGHARDDAQGMEVLRASLLTQDTKLRAENVDHRF